MDKNQAKFEEVKSGGELNQNQKGYFFIQGREMNEIVEESEVSIGGVPLTAWIFEGQYVVGHKCFALASVLAYALVDVNVHGCLLKSGVYTSSLKVPSDPRANEEDTVDCELREQ